MVVDVAGQSTKTSDWSSPSTTKPPKAAPPSLVGAVQRTVVDLLRRYSNLPNFEPALQCLQHGRTRRPSSVTSKPPVARRHKLTQRLDPATVARLVADYEAGTPSTQLMRDYRLGKGSVLRLLREHGAAMRNQGLRDEQVVEAARLYQAGWALKRVGDHLGVDHETVRQALRRSGMMLRGPHDHRLAP